MRSRDGEMIGARAGPDGIRTICWASVTRSTARRTIAVAWAVRHAVTPMMSSVMAAVATPASGQRNDRPAPAATRSPAPRPTAVTTPKVVGRRCVLTRNSVRPEP